MTHLAQTAPAGRPLPSARDRAAALFEAEPRMRALGLALALATVPTALALTLDPRVLDGAPIWLKPLKFEIALAIYLLSLAFFARYLPLPMRRSRRWRIYALAVCGAVLAEMLWIGGAALLGTRSHFNEATPLAAALYGAMGLLAVLLTSASAVMGWAILRRGTGLAPALREAVGLGLVLTFALTVPVAFTMSGMGGHHVGAVSELARAVPVLGWSREAGDLRVAHFLATHAMHALPLAGLLAGVLAPPRRARAAVRLAAAGWSLATLASFAQALAGLPLLPA